MRGSLRKRGAGWQLRVVTGIDLGTSKRSFDNKSVRETRRESEREFTRMVWQPTTRGGALWLQPVSS